MRDDVKRKNMIRSLLIFVVFFVSGISALTYQLAWQRKLFSIFGTNIESITVVVTAFMMGLGLGSLAGGILSQRKNFRVLPAFAIVELGIGVYGLLSMRLMESISNASSMSVAMTGIVSFALVLVPTLLMGATLPLLVTHLVRGNQNVGQSVGLLYFANTIGAAFGALIGATIWFRFYGLSGSVHIAVILNFASAIVVGLLAITEKSISGKLEAEGK